MNPVSAYSLLLLTATLSLQAGAFGANGPTAKPDGTAEALAAAADAKRAPAQAACSPDYSQLKRDDCLTVESGSVAQEDDKVVREGLCELRISPDAYCQEADVKRELRGKWQVGGSALQFQYSDVDNRIDLCGNLESGIKQKRNITCYYKVAVPVPKYVSGPECPVNGAVESNGCYVRNGVAVADVVVNATVINACLAMKVDTDARMWKKVTCLVDLVKADSDLALNRQKSGISGQTIEDAVSQLIRIRRSTKTPPAVIRYINGNVNLPQ